MAERSAAAVQLLLLLIATGAAVMRTVEGCGDDLTRCKDDECCSSITNTCGKGPAFCHVSACTCSGGYCDIPCPRPPPRIIWPPPKRKCFPGHATVQLEGGRSKTMEELALGDRVAVWSADTGRVAYDEIYAFGHKDALVVSPMVKIDMAAEASSASIELSAAHFVPTKHEGAVLYKRAEDVVLGDYLWATNSSGRAATHVVTEISSCLKHGAFNPFTAQGSIVVDGVVASVHSDWFLDPLFNWLGFAHHLPAVYQVVLAPARLLYTVLGRELYIAIYTALDARLNLADFGNEHGGEVVATASVGFLAALAVFLTVRSTSYSRRMTKCQNIYVCTGTNIDIPVVDVQKNI